MCKRSLPRDLKDEELWIQPSPFWVSHPFDSHYHPVSRCHHCGDKIYNNTPTRHTLPYCCAPYFQGLEAMLRPPRCGLHLRWVFSRDGDGLNGTTLTKFYWHTYVFWSFLQNCTTDSLSIFFLCVEDRILLVKCATSKAEIWYGYKKSTFFDVFTMIHFGRARWTLAEHL